MDNINAHFLQACYDGNTTAIKEKYLGAVDINYCCPHNGHGLYLAATQGHEATVELLLENGAIDAIAMGSSTSALHMAVFKGFFNIVILILEKSHQLSVDIRTKSGETPLHSAAKQGFASITLKLLEHGADPDSCTQSLDTPMHFAALRNQLALFDRFEKNYPETLRVLLFASRHTHSLAKNKDSETFLTVAEKNGWLDDVKLIYQNTLILKKLAIQSIQPPILNAFHLSKQKKEAFSQDEFSPETTKKASPLFTNRNF